MPTTATKPKPKTETAAQSLARLNQQLRNQSIADWQRWAGQIADGGSPPDGRELLAVAAALDIADPLAELRADADAILEARAAVIHMQDCDKALAAALAPHGGTVQALDAKIADAQAVVEELRAVHLAWADGGPRLHHVNRLHHLRVAHARLWPEYATNGTAKEL
jgi:hypothetical protein